MNIHEQLNMINAFILKAFMDYCEQIWNVMNHTNGGEIGIRTLVTLTHPTDFESGPFDRSGISPGRNWHCT